MWHNRSPLRQTYPERADTLFASGTAPPCIVVYVDAWTAYGGSQFVDSPGTGPVPHLPLRRCGALRRRPLPDAGRPRAPGHPGQVESGGFGAMITPMLRPDLFGGLATHAGDALYECCYIPEFPKAARALRPWEGRSSGGGRTSGAASPSPIPTTSCCSSCWAWPPASRPTTTARRTCPSTRRPARCATTCGRAGWPGTRCAWCPTTPRPCGGSGPSGSTPAPVTSGTSTSARWPSGTQLAAVGVTDVALRALRRRPRRDRLAVPAVAGLPGRAPRCPRPRQLPHPLKEPIGGRHGAAC